MALSYNQVAGRRVDRIAALSDGVFAIAMTLIVLVQLKFAIAPTIPILSRV
jgi:hypothetical protein